VNAEAFAFDFKLRQAMFRKERKEITQLVHRKLLFRAARLALLRLVATPPTAITIPL
jgi:hypothetical protein